MGTKHLHQIAEAWRTAPLIGGPGEGWRGQADRPYVNVLPPRPPLKLVWGTSPYEKVKYLTYHWHRYIVPLPGGLRLDLPVFLQATTPTDADTLAVISYLQCHRN